MSFLDEIDVAFSDIIRGMSVALWEAAAATIWVVMVKKLGLPVSFYTFSSEYDDPQEHASNERDYFSVVRKIHEAAVGS